MRVRMYFLVVTAVGMLVGLQQADATESWKTYRSPAYGFEIQYPDFLEPLHERAVLYFSLVGGICG
jgi:hypothetical protein